MDIDSGTAPPAEPHSVDVPHALVVVGDAGLSASVRRVGAAADRPLDEAGTPVSRRAWDTATTVVLDADAAGECAATLPRRPRVVLVCAGPPTLQDWKAATAVGAEYVFGVPDDEAALVGVFAERHEPRTGGGGVIAVIGGCGGAGASTLAAAVALAAADDRSSTATLLVDGDPLGGGLDLLAGVEDRPGLRWPGLTVEGGRVSARALHEALPGRGRDVEVLACGRRSGTTCGPTAAAASAVVEAGRRAGDLVVCDVPRYPSEVGDMMLDTAELVVTVVPALIRSCLAAEQVAARVSERNANQGLVVRGPAPGGLRGSDIAEVLGLPLIAAMRPEPDLAEMLERGGLRLRRRSPLAAAARSILDVLSAKPGPGRWAA